MKPYEVRELVVLDVRCQAKECGAGPGEHCKITPFSTAVRFDPKPVVHEIRYQEFIELKEAGWRWQEPDPTDAGEPRKP